MRLDGAYVDALVEYPLAAAPHLDAGAGRAFHAAHALGDIAGLRANVGPANEEVVGQTVQRDPEVGFHAVVPQLPDGQPAGTDQRLVGDPTGNGEPGAIDDGVGVVVDAVGG